MFDEVSPEFFRAMYEEFKRSGLWETHEDQDDTADFIGLYCAT